VKFNSTGTIQWTTRYNGRSDDSGQDFPIAIKVNSGDYAYVTGSSSNPSGQLLFTGVPTIKYDPNGKQLWATRYKLQRRAPIALALSGGDVLVTGVSNGATTSADWVTIDYVQDAAKVSPTSLSFGSQKVGTVSASKTVILTKYWRGPACNHGISITGEFQLTNNWSKHCRCGSDLHIYRQVRAHATWRSRRHCHRARQLVWQRCSSTNGTADRHGYHVS